MLLKAEPEAVTGIENRMLWWFGIEQIVHAKIELNIALFSEYRAERFVVH